MQTGSFSAAAREEGTAQATVSKKIAALEKSLGAQLLLRNQRTMSLTSVGEAFFERCVFIFGELDKAETEVALAQIELNNAKEKRRIAQLNGQLPRAASSHSDIRRRHRYCGHWCARC